MRVINDTGRRLTGADRRRAMRLARKALRVPYDRLMIEHITTVSAPSVARDGDALVVSRRHYPADVWTYVVARAVRVP